MSQTPQPKKKEQKLTPKQKEVLKGIKEGVSPVFRDRWKERGHRVTIQWLEDNGWIEKKNEKYVLTKMGINALKDKDKIKESINSGEYSWSGILDKYDPGKNKVIHYVNKSGKAVCNSGKPGGGRSYDIDRDKLFRKLPRCRGCTLKINKTTLT